MNRRQFLYAVAATPVALLLGSKLVAMLRHYPLHNLLSELERLPVEQLSSTGEWSVSEIFQHCAQSIQYSLFGYPEAKSAFFQHTIGNAALSAFSAAGSMSHPLTEAIPGAPALNPDMPLDIAKVELVMELKRFIDWQGMLAPHFAYGPLTKQQYYAAHYLHLQNHLSEIRLNGQPLLHVV